MAKKTQINEVMTKQVVTVSLESHLAQVIDMFKQNRFRHMPVVNGNEIVGMVSSSDINRLTFGNLFNNQEAVDHAIIDMLTIDQVMTSNVESVRPETTIEEVANIFVKKDYHALPVVEDNLLKGIITTTDIIKYYLQQSKI